MSCRAVLIQSLGVLCAAALYAPAQDTYTEPELKPKDSTHWSFQVPVRPTLPRPNTPYANPIDAFIRARLEQANVKPAPAADKLTLIRRLSLDLTGLPPTPAEVDEFIKDGNPTAYEKLVERLLASPHFGERCAQHWLDVARFAETNGYEADAPRPHAWRYRDYVVKCYNDDLPYDQFVREQIAGDEIAGSAWGEKPHLLIATGMHRCGPVHLVSGNLAADGLRQEVLTEMVNGIGTSFLGLTLACCRCHDHKFDPLSAGDYYRIQAFFSGARYSDAPFASAAEKDAREKRAAAIAAETAPLIKQLGELDGPVRALVTKQKREKLEQKYRSALDTPADKRSPEERTLAAHAATLIKASWDEVLAAMSVQDREKRAALRAKLHALQAQIPPPSAAAWAIQNTGPPTKTFVLKRGEVSRKTREVGPGLPRVLVRGAEAPRSRLDLANWITKPDHPLTARVIVNRLWAHHFGRGIVATPNDFGLRGDRPSHPELLDWLACELVNPTPNGAGGKDVRPWSLKQIHRLIVTSETYRQAAAGTQGSHIDPDNKLLWKMPRRRLEAEAIRDSILTAAGTLNRQIGGVSVKVPLEPEVYDLIFTEDEPDGLWLVTPDVTQHTRRSLYLFNKRNVRHPLLDAFDQPDTLNSCAVRPVSTFAPQALILMNSPFVHTQARAMAVRLVREVGTNTEGQLNALYRSAFGRLPRESERKLAMEFLKGQEKLVLQELAEKRSVGIDPNTLPAGAQLAEVRALADLCGVLFNTHEFVYIP